MKHWFFWWWKEYIRTSQNSKIKLVVRLNKKFLHIKNFPKWEEDDYMCGNYLLNCLSDELKDIMINGYNISGKLCIKIWYWGKGQRSTILVCSSNFERNNRKSIVEQIRELEMMVHIRDNIGPLRDASRRCDGQTVKSITQSWRICSNINKKNFPSKT